MVGLFRKQQGGAVRAGDHRVLHGAEQQPLRQDRVVAAVASLYADRLEPFGRILLRRIREICAKELGHSGPGSIEDAPIIDPKALRRVCMACSELSVRPVEGKEISVLLKNHPTDFVDVCSPVDPFPAEFWEQAEAYFEDLDDDKLLLPGGRYACAQALVARRLPFLKDLSLGQVCHFVQLCVSQKRILGFTDGGMVPYCHSETSVKERCAAVQQPFASTSSWPVATWEQARACLASILHAADGGEPGVITISNVKRLFRSRFGLDLSETALGHSRLTDLLQDPRLYDICSVEIRGTGHCVVCRLALPEDSLVWVPPEACEAMGLWSPPVWTTPVDAEMAVAPELVAHEHVCWDTYQPFIPLSTRVATGAADAPTSVSPPAFDLPCAPPPGLSFEGWGGCLPHEPMKVPLSEHMLASHFDKGSEFDKDLGQVAFLNFAKAHPDSEAPCRPQLQHHRSRSVSTSPGSEHIYDSDGSGH